MTMDLEPLTALPTTTSTHCSKPVAFWCTTSTCAGSSSSASATRPRGR